MSSLHEQLLSEDDDLNLLGSTEKTPDWEVIEATRRVPTSTWEVGKLWPDAYVKPTRIIEPRKPAFSAATLLNIIVAAIVAFAALKLMG